MKLAEKEFKQKLQFVDKRYSILSILILLLLSIGLGGLLLQFFPTPQGIERDGITILLLCTVSGIGLGIYAYYWKQKRLTQFYQNYLDNGKLYYTCFPNITTLTQHVPGTGRYGLCVQIFAPIADRLIDYSDAVVKNYHEDQQLKERLQTMSAMELTPLQDIVMDADPDVLYCVRAEVKGAKNPRDVIKKAITLTDEAGQMYHFNLKK